MKAMLRLTIMLVSGLGLLSSTRLLAQTQGVEHDGVWAATVQCGPQLQTGRAGFTSKTEFTLLRGQIKDTKSQVVAGVREETRWEGRVDQSQLVLQGQAQRDNGATWSYQLAGALTPDRATLSGSMSAQGQKIRDCSVDLAISQPAPGSLAARTRAAAAQPAQVLASVTAGTAPLAPAPAASVPAAAPAATTPAEAALPAGVKQIDSRTGPIYVAAARPAAKPATAPAASTPVAEAPSPAAPAVPTVQVHPRRSTDESARMMAQAKAAYDRKDYAAALKIYASLADEGQALAQARLGLLYKYGDGVPRKASTACAWYRKSAEQGDAEGQDRLGDCYNDGEGVKADIKQAVDWYTRSAAQGLPRANDNLARLYESGEGVPLNIGKAIELFTVAANGGRELALLHLGGLFSEGSVVARDDAKAFGWYDKAARQGSDEGQNHLAEMYAKGRGTPQSDVQAINWWREAAEQGYRPAQNQLGLMYDLGKGVARDAVQAVSWYRKAADGGNASAMLNLGTMYECGSGVGKDLVAAKTWYLNAMKADEPAGLRAAIRLDQAARHAAMPGLRDGSSAAAGPCKT